MELTKLSESHRISHHQAGSAARNPVIEEHEGTTAGIGEMEHADLKLLMHIVNGGICNIMYHKVWLLSTPCN